MIKRLTVSLVFLAFACVALLPAAAQKFNPRDDIAMMVDTERSFSQMSEQEGIREAFAAFIADDGILFRPRAVVGKKWMQEHPLPPSDKRPLLTWQPIYAFMSRSADL